MVEGRAVASALVFRAFLPPHPGPTAIELEESTTLFSLSSDGGGGEGRGEESRFYWISPLPARSSQAEGDRRSTFQCLIQRQWGQGEGERDGGEGECFADLGGPIVILSSILRIHQHVSQKQIGA